MELWIRSQDKMDLVKVRDVGINYKNQIIANYAPELYENGGEYYVLLGTYDSKERALEVLDEISDLMIPTGLDENEEYTSERCFTNKNMMYYQMPEE